MNPKSPERCQENILKIKAVSCAMASAVIKSYPGALGYLHLNG